MIRKMGGNPEDYRSLCLINEGSKLLERILVERVWRKIWRITERYLGIAPRQFGFRRSRSTVHAMKEIEKIIKNGEKKELITIAVSIDIRNAFNSLSWEVIGKAL